MRIRAVFSAGAVFFAATLGASDFQGFLLRLAPPSPGEFSAETSFREIANPVYADADGRSDELAHSLELFGFSASVSYGLSSSFAVGVVGSYGVNRSCCFNGKSISDSGFTGAGIFLDWRAGRSSDRPSVVRLGYETERGPGNALLPVSDGQDRVFLRSDWSILAAGRGRARLGMRIDIDYGRPFEIQKPFFRVSGELVPQVVLTRSPSFRLDLLGIAGFVGASDARENGTIFHNRRSTEGRAGAGLDFGLGRDSRSQVLLEATHDFAARNALSGWRFGVTLRRLFGSPRP